MNFSTIKFETLQSAIGLITLNRPERLNAINLDMLEELHVLFGQLNNDENVRVTIITGEGRGFCSGADLLDKRLTKETLNQNQNAPSLEAAVELENRNQSILCVTPEFFKAVEKFGKRKVSVLKHKEDLKSE